MIEFVVDNFSSGRAARQAPAGRGGRWRWAVGLAAALAVHLGIGLAILGIDPPTRFRIFDQGDPIGVISASLMEGRSVDEAAQRAASRHDDLNEMLEALATPTPSQVAATGPDSAKASTLSDLFGDDADNASQAGGRSSEARENASGFDYGAQASIGRGRPGSSSGPVGPCWGRPERPTPVVMAILLDKNGGLVGRPRIISAGQGPADPRAPEYERLAMRAMAGCAPFSLAPPGIYESYRLDFSRETVRLIRLGPVAGP